MCGILLAVGSTWRQDFATALTRLASRGPDASEISAHGDALLGHARLAVIDIAGGRQPMLSSDGRWALVYNGEIYNFRCLRRELEAAGHVFATHSDSEVLLTGYRHWGESVVERLDGMFAFAIHDRENGSVFAARDRVGIKPLFWGVHGGGLIIASTLSPFFAFRDLPKKLDPEGLRDYLAFQTPIAPWTLVQGIHALPPANCLNWTPGRQGTIRRWWSIPDPAADIPPTAEDLADAVDSLLAKAIQDQLVADVPLGAFLSGGIDSSLVVHYMAQAGGPSASRLKTFSVRFAEAGFDESPAARAIAERYNTDHHVLDAPQMGTDTLDAALGALDQPLADPAYVPTWALSKLTRGHVTVALSGDGGDELFGGYPRFLETADRFPDGTPKRVLRWLLQSGLAPASLTRRSLAGAELLLYRRVELGNYPGCRKDLRRYLDPELAVRAKPDETLQRWRDLVSAHGGYDQAGLLRADLWTYLSENCLAKTDRASMAHGLEVRVPLLANAVQDRVLALPARVHFDSGGGKAVLRALARRHLPDIVWNRPKHGFSVPLRQNLAGTWHDWCDALFSQAAARAPWLNEDALSVLWRETRQGKANPRLAYTFIVLLAWLAHHPLDV